MQSMCQGRQGRRGIAAVTVASCLLALVPGAASAQLPIPLFPQPEPSPTPAPTPAPAPAPAPGGSGPGLEAGEIGAYRGYGRTGTVAGDTLAGPTYRAWSVALKATGNHPLIVGDQVLVNVSSTTGDYGSTVRAYDLRTGKQRWSTPTPGVYFSAPMSADRTTVVSVNLDGIARGIAVADGALRWERDLGSRAVFSGGPIVHDGLAYAPVEDGIHVLDAATGADRFLIPVSSAEIALDGGRLFATNCSTVSGVRAFDARSGAGLWDASVGSGECTSPKAQAGRVYVGRSVLDAATGAPAGALSVTPAAIGPAHAFAFSTRLSAYRLGDGARAWSRKLPVGTGGGSNVGALAPVAGDATIYVASPGAFTQLDPETGKVRWTSDNPGDSGYSSHGGIDPGLAVGPGVAVVVNGTRMSAFAPVLQPTAGGVDVAWSTLDVRAGASVRIAARTGATLGRVPVVVQRDPFPRGAFRRAKTVQPDAARVAQTTIKVARNTRFRAAAGGARSRSFTVYAYPRIRFGRLTYARSSRRFTQPVTITKAPTRGRRVVLYLGRVAADQAVRLGSARLRGGRARVRFAPPKRAGSKDVLIVCVPGLARAGYGRVDALEKRCGARRITVKL